MFSFLSGPYGLLIKVLSVLGLLTGIYFYGHYNGSESVQVKYDLFVAETKATAETARADAVIKEAKDKANKEKADNENKTARTVLSTTIKRLRDERASGSFVPATPANAERPDLTCFDPTQLERAIRSLDRDLQRLVDEGSENSLDLNTAKRWAQDGK